ncbi:MAG: DUF3971 domain-containing protein [Pseudomonadota bacterium]
MSLRTGLLISLLAIALASLGLYFGLTRQGGVGLPGGKAAIEQTLAGYVKEGTLSLSAPRVAYMEDGKGVILTLRSIQFELADMPAMAELQRITARVDAGRLAQGAIRLEEVTIEKAALSYTFEGGQEPGALPKPQALFAQIAETYDAVFTEMHLERLAALDIKQLLIELMEDDDLAAQGRGGLKLRPAGEGVQLNAEMAWTGREAIKGNLATQLFAIAGPDQPLDLVLTAQSDALKGTFAQSDIDVQQLDLRAQVLAGKGAPAGVQVSMTSTQARVKSPKVYPNGADFKDVNILAAYRSEGDAAVLEVRDLGLADTTFTATATLKDISQETTSLEAKGVFSDMDVAILKAYWPEGVGGGGRLWVVENIEAGTLRKTVLNVDAPLAALADDSADTNALTITFTLDDAIAHYRRPMSPIVNAYARARMTLDDLRFDIEKGSVGGVDVAGSTVILTSFRASPQRAEIDLRVDGSAGLLATVLDSEPLGYFTAYGIEPTALDGPIAGRALLALPLLKNLPIDDVRITARIDANRLALRDILGPRDALLRRVVIDVTQAGMKLRGDYSIDGLDGAIRWEEDFTGETQTPTQVALTGKIAPEGLPTWLPGAGNAVFGTVFYDASVSGRGATIAKATVTADLTAAALNIRELGYDKPVGVAGELYTSLKSEGDDLVFDAITLNAPDMLLIGDGRFNDTAGTANISFNTVEVGETKGTLTLSRQDDNWLVAGALDTLDIRPILSMFWAGALAPPAGEEAESSNVEDIVSVSIDAGTILMDNEKSAGQTRFLGSVQGDHVRQLNVFGQGPGDAPFTLTIEPTQAGRRLVLAAEQAGELASGLGMMQTAQGGRLSIQATSFERGEELGLAGILEMTDIRLKEAPVLARMLGLGSLSGVADLARNRGINFTDVQVPFELNNGVVRVTNASAYGPAMGLTADGEFLDSFERADIRGVIVPSYTINSALGKVPVLGNLLIGGEGTGLFGINYKLSGALAEPDLDVNPASMLTPGFLRGIFGKQRGRLGEVQSEPLTPTADTAEAGGL